jgi:hypothetical protein
MNRLNFEINIILFKRGLGFNLTPFGWEVGIRSRNEYINVSLGPFSLLYDSDAVDYFGVELTAGLL